MTFPITQAFGYALAYAKTTINKALFPSKAQTGTWGPRYRGIDDDVATKDLLTVCAIQWRRSVEKALEEFVQIPEANVLTIRYEDFVTEPREHLTKIAVFLGLNPEFYRNADLSHISNSNIGKGLKNLNNSQIETIMDVIRPPLRRLGYL